MFRDLVDDLDGFSIEPNTFLDVPFVPTDERVIEAMFDLAGVGRDDILYDLGSGDGRIVVAAAKDRDARAIGIEMDPLRIADAMEYAGDSRVEYMVDFREEDLFSADFSEATVITLYLLDSVNARLRPRLLNELKPGTRIVSHAFDMGDWKADQVLEVGGVKLYKWTVPAQVNGTWEWDDFSGEPYRLELQQQFQVVSGTAWVADEAATLLETHLCGASLDVQIQMDDAPAKRFTLNFEDGELESVLEHDD